MKRILQRRNFALAALALLAAGAVSHFAPPVLERYRNWEAERHLQRAREAAGADDWRVVQDQLETLGGRLRNRYDRIRLHILLAIETGEALPSALLVKSFVHPDATPADRTELLDIALRGDDLLTFARLYNLLPDERRTDPEIVLRKGRLLLRLGRHRELVALLREPLRAGEDQPAHRLLLMRALLAPEATGEWYDLAQDLAADLMRRNLPEGRTAFRLLGLIPPRFWNPGRLPDLPEQLERWESPTTEERLVAATAEYLRLPATERAGFVDRTRRRVGAADPVALTRWLLALGRAEKAEQRFDRDAYRERPDLYQRRLRLLVSAAEWERAADWLESPPRDMEPIHVWLQRARVARGADDTAEWRRCLEHALFSADIVVSHNHYFDISGEAMLMGHLDLAARAARSGIRHPMAIIPPAAYFDPVLEFLWRESRLEEFESILRPLRKREPTDSYLASNAIYLTILRQRNEPPGGRHPSTRAQPLARRAVALVSQFPDRPAFRTSAALALETAGRPLAAMRLLDTVDPASWQDADDASQAILALVLQRASHENESRRWRETVDPESLNELERASIWEPLVREGVETRQLHPRSSPDSDRAGSNFPALPGS